MVRPRSDRTEDGGFTLIELVITIVILGIITVPLANFVIEYFKYTADTSGRVSESHDVQITSAYFAQDVASLGTRNQSTQVLNQSVWKANATGAPYTCGSPTPVVLFAGDRFAGAGAPTVVEVSYATATVGTEYRLTRTTCAGPTAPAVTSVVAHDLDPSTPPTASCYLSGATTDCGGGGASTPTSVTLTLSLKDPKDTGSSYTVTLSGERRQT
jgi:prepilin-type N-terminal cleavage/methylation domain-containing protein